MIVILSILVLLFCGHLQANDYVEVGLGWGYDSIWHGESSVLEVSIENDVKLQGISLGFQIYSPDGVTWVLDDFGYTQFAPATPNGGTFVRGVEGSRWMSGAATDGSCWDLGGTLVNDNLVPNQFLVGGAAISAGLEPGPLEPMLYVYFTADAPQGITTLCIDSAFYPPAGFFVFDPGGTPWSNLPLCLPVVNI